MRRFREQSVLTIALRWVPRAFGHNSRKRLAAAQSVCLAVFDAAHHRPSAQA